ncbi:hypothetical protein PAL_GLEAN10005854 [Pteropus alecto]|uniref:Uncharacterized protein n=1 Tax=Pteropus alecto TaxID=9402 RepID=L5K2R4_PTEAL|nr:hypothetical protein PAL_GLEAN10005854 [Pteropus alecto]
MQEDWESPIFTLSVNEKGQAIKLANLSLKLRTDRKEEGDGSNESKNMAKEDKEKENRELRGRGREEQDYLPMAGSGKVPVTAPPSKPLTDSNANHSPTAAEIPVCETALWEAVHVTPAGSPGRVPHSSALTGLTSDFSVSSCLLRIALDSQVLEFYPLLIL